MKGQFVQKTVIDIKRFTDRVQPRLSFFNGWHAVASSATGPGRDMTGLSGQQGEHVKPASRFSQQP